MRSHLKAAVLSFLILASCTAGLCAEPEKASRAATKKDIVGTWDMVSVRPVHDEADATFFPYQRFVFNGNSSMKFMASKEPFTKDWLAKFQKQQSEIDFAVNERGVLSLIWHTPAHTETAVCAYVIKDVPTEIAAKLSPAARKGLPKKGDITLSFLNSRGKIAYQKVLTKIG